MARTIECRQETLVTSEPRADVSPAAAGYAQSSRPVVRGPLRSSRRCSHDTRRPPVAASPLAWNHRAFGPARRRGRVSSNRSVGRRSTPLRWARELPRKRCGRHPRPRFARFPFISDAALLLGVIIALCFWTSAWCCLSLRFAARIFGRRRCPSTPSNRGRSCRTSLGSASHGGRIRR